MQQTRLLGAGMLSEFLLVLAVDPLIEFIVGGFSGCYFSVILSLEELLTESECLHQRD